MMYIDNEVLEKMIMTMVEGFNRLEKKLDRMNRLKDCLDGDTLLDNCVRKYRIFCGRGERKNRFNYLYLREPVIFLQLKDSV